MIECPAFWIEKDCRHKTSQNRSSTVAATTFGRLETLERRSGGCVDAFSWCPQRGLSNQGTSTEHPLSFNIELLVEAA